MSRSKRPTPMISTERPFRAREHFGLDRTKIRVADSNNLNLGASGKAVAALPHPLQANALIRQGQLLRRRHRLGRIQIIGLVEQRIERSPLRNVYDRSVSGPALDQPAQRWRTGESAAPPVAVEPPGRVPSDQLRLSSTLASDSARKPESQAPPAAPESPTGPSRSTAPTAPCSEMPSSARPGPNVSAFGDGLAAAAAFWLSAVLLAWPSDAQDAGLARLNRPDP